MRYNVAVALAFFIQALVSVNSAFAAGFYFEGKARMSAADKAQIHLVHYEWGASSLNGNDRIQISIRRGKSVPSFTGSDSLLILLSKLGKDNRPQGTMQLIVPCDLIKAPPTRGADANPDNDPWFYCEFPKMGNGVPTMRIDSVKLRSKTNDTPLEYWVQSNRDNLISHTSGLLKKVVATKINCIDSPAPAVIRTPPTESAPLPSAAEPKFRIVWTDTGIKDEFDSLKSAQDALLKIYPPEQISAKPVFWDVFVTKKTESERHVARVEPLVLAAQGIALTPALPSDRYRIVLIENGQKKECANLDIAKKSVENAFATETISYKPIAFDVYSKDGKEEKYIARIEPVPVSAPSVASLQL